MHDEDDQERREHQREQEVARQETRFRPEAMTRDVARLLYLDIFIVFGGDAPKQRRAASFESEHDEKQESGARSQEPEGKRFASSVS